MLPIFYQILSGNLGYFHRKSLSLFSKLSYSYLSKFSLNFTIYNETSKIEMKINHLPLVLVLDLSYICNICVPQLKQWVRWGKNRERWENSWNEWVEGSNRNCSLHFSDRFIIFNDCFLFFFSLQSIFIFKIWFVCKKFPFSAENQIVVLKYFQK